MIENKKVIQWILFKVMQQICVAEKEHKRNVTMAFREALIRLSSL